MIFTEGAMSALAGFLVRPLSSILKLKFGDVGFCGGRKTGEPGKNLGARREINNKLNSHTALTRQELDPGFIGRRRALSRPCFHSHL